MMLIIDGELIKAKKVVRLSPTQEGIINLLKRRKMTPTLMANKLGRHKSTISKQLKILSILNIVSFEQKRREKFFALNKDEI